MDAYCISEEIISIKNWFRPKFFGIITTDQDPEVFIHGSTIERVGLLPANETVEPPIIGKYVLTEPKEGKLDSVLKVLEHPMFGFEFTDQEANAFIQKIQKREPLTDEEEYFYGALFRADVDGLVAPENFQRWKKLRSIVTLTDPEKAAKQPYRPHSKFGRWFQRILQENASRNH